MWVLSVDCKELRFFASPEDIEDGFAALSHVWNNRPEDGSKEQSFQDIQEIQERCRKDDTLLPRDLVSEKIRRCCELAEMHRYKWVWIDTCCINKTSSAELSEAINSMFRYYSLAGVCYGYLRDVPFIHNIYDSLADRRLFLRSVWFQRGWTLQELIAPRFFVFLSQDWETLGTKSDFANILEEEFRIPAAVLNLQVSHAEFSVAQRMSWFGTRKTSRLEDEAYCLLGIFDIHMPTLYGEGRKAFRRLQEEIMKKSTDTTLFAWTGLGCNGEYRSCLFAPSPSEFDGTRITYTPPLPQHLEVQDDPTGTHKGVSLQTSSLVKQRDTTSDSRGRMDITFSVTPYGVLVCLPLIPYAGDRYGDLYWSTKCGNMELRGFLHLEEDSDISARSSRFRSYSISSRRIFWTSCLSDTAGYHTINEQKAEWGEILIRPHQTPLHAIHPGRLSDPPATSLPAMPRQLALDAPFRIDEPHMRTFLREFGADRVEISSGDSHHLSSTHPKLPIMYTVIRTTGYHARKLFVIFRVGQCSKGDSSGDPLRPSPVWVTVSSKKSSPEKPESESQIAEEITQLSQTASHDCLEDHVSQWHASQKSFTLDSEPETTVTLSSSPCPLNPQRTVILDVHLDKRKSTAEVVDRGEQEETLVDVRDLDSTVRYIRHASLKVLRDLKGFDIAGFKNTDGDMLCVSPEWEQLREKFCNTLNISRESATSTAELMRLAMLEDVDESHFPALRAELGTFMLMLVNGQTKPVTATANDMFEEIAKDVFDFSLKLSCVMSDAHAHLRIRIEAMQHRVAYLHGQLQPVGLPGSGSRIDEMTLQQLHIKEELEDRRKEIVQLSGQRDALCHQEILPLRMSDTLAQSRR